MLLGENYHYLCAFPLCPGAQVQWKCGGKTALSIHCGVKKGEEQADHPQIHTSEGSH